MSLSKPIGLKTYLYLEACRRKHVDPSGTEVRRLEVSAAREQIKKATAVLKSFGVRS